VNTCKSGNNTWAYVGDINDKPQLSCVYQSDDAQNEFLSNPKVRSLRGRGRDLAGALLRPEARIFSTQLFPLHLIQTQVGLGEDYMYD